MSQYDDIEAYRNIFASVKCKKHMQMCTKICAYVKCKRHVQNMHRKIHECASMHEKQTIWIIPPTYFLHSILSVNVYLPIVF